MEIADVKNISIRLYYMIANEFEMENEDEILKLLEGL